MELLLALVLSLKRTACTERGFSNTVHILSLLSVHIAAADVRQHTAGDVREPCGNEAFGR